MNAPITSPDRPPVRTSASQQRTRRGRGVPAMYGAVTLVLVAATVTFALSSPPPNTPPLAEVAPAPQEQVDVERVEQSSPFGDGAAGDGDCAPGEDCAGVGTGEMLAAPSPPPPAEAESVPGSHGRLRACVNGPGGPRQTEDPQSPPCKAEIFQGDNGGRTWQGVTDTEVRIAVLNADDQNEGLYQAWASHFNRYYEFHGRQLTIVPVRVSTSDPTEHRAAARTVAEQDVFAATTFSRLGPFQEELAALGVVHTIDADKTAMPTQAHLASLAPYAWSLFPTLDENLATTAELICRSLAGRPAQHGGEDVADRTRRFGVLVEAPGPKAGPPYDASLLENRLASCGADHRSYRIEHPDADPRTVFSRMVSDGVTTVVCVCDDFDRTYTAAAEGIAFRPEWLHAATDDYWIMSRQRHATAEEHPREQLAHLFGLWRGPRRPPIQGVGTRFRVHGEYWFNAARAEDPAVTGDPGFHQYAEYAELLMLASGIQWAGPELTPETFAGALQRIRFPNPDPGAAPWFQASVGFGPEDRAFVSDYALFWWRDPSDSGYQSRSDIGDVCFVGGGTRYTAATLPADADALFFDPEAGCR